MYVGGHRDETLLGISPVGTTVAGNLVGAVSLGPAEFKVAFAAQVRGSLAVIGGQVRFRGDKGGLDFAVRRSEARENDGAEGLVEFGVGGYESEDVC